jgi:hypothetical protein
MSDECWVIIKCTSKVEPQFKEYKAGEIVSVVAMVKSLMVIVF